MPKKSTATRKVFIKKTGYLNAKKIDSKLIIKLNADSVCINLFKINL